MAEPVTFSYPAYGEPIAQLQLKAQVLGDEDFSPLQQTILFTRNNSAVVRKTNTFTQRKSNWTFSAICDIEEVRVFFKNGEGNYFLYTHYDGTRWVFHLLGTTYQISSEQRRSSILANQSRTDKVNHTFSLQVERWQYA